MNLFPVLDSTATLGYLVKSYAGQPSQFISKPSEVVHQLSQLVPSRLGKQRRVGEVKCITPTQCPLIKLTVIRVMLFMIQSMYGQPNC